MDAGVVDAVDDAQNVSIHLMVGNAQDAKTTGGKDCVALSISAALLNVNGAIYFDDEAGGMAIEINYETLEDMLASEVETHVSITTQMLP